MTTNPTFSSAGFDLDALAEALPHTDGTKKEEDVVYEIGGGATRVSTTTTTQTANEEGEADTNKRTTNDNTTDDNDNTVLQVALDLKEQGNVAYKAGEYSLAYDKYTAAIDATPGPFTGADLWQHYKTWQQDANTRARQALNDRDVGKQSSSPDKDNNTSSDGEENDDTKPATKASDEPHSNDDDKSSDDDNNTTFVPPTNHPHGTTLAVFYCNRAAALMGLERYQEAADDAQVSLWLHPTYLKAHVRASQAQERLGNSEPALQHAQTAVEVATADSTTSPHTLRQLRHTAARLQRDHDQKMEQLKTETMAKLKDLGNSILGNFGLSLDNFQAVQDPNTGSYSISFDQSNNNNNGSNNNNNAANNNQE